MHRKTGATLLFQFSTMLASMTGCFSKKSFAAQGDDLGSTEPSGMDYQ